MKIIELKLISSIVVSKVTMTIKETLLPQPISIISNSMKN